MKVLVIGAARSGVAIAKLLKQNDYDVILTDLKKLEDKRNLEAMGIVVYDDGHPHELLAQKYDVVIKNPGIPHTSPFIRALSEQGYFIYNEIEVASRMVSYTIAAITGTNGKTTTTSLLEAMLKRKDERNLACGNIGLAFSEVVAEKGNVALDVAMEIAAFQLLGCDRFKPKISGILNLAPDHLDVLGEVKAYYAAKCRIYQAQDESDYFLKNLDDENIVALTQDVKAQVLTFSLVKEADIKLENDWVVFKDIKLFAISTLKITGMHNVSNAMVAASMAYLMGVELSDIQAVCAEFTGVEHRLEYITTIQGVRYYNDSKATTAESTEVALKAFDSNIILLAGGYDKKTGFDILKPHLHRLKAMYAYGVTRDQFKQLYPDAILVDTMEEALNRASLNAKAGDVVLLSPACASYDQFDNYEQRGKLFKQFVHALKAKE
jgi:UDP-N-acetylmuramoylalanine--D-glutamate ligase